MWVTLEFVKGLCWVLVSVTCRGCLQRCCSGLNTNAEVGELGGISAFYCRRMCLLFGKGEITVFGTISVWDDCFKRFQADLACQGSLLKLLEFHMGELHR